MAGNSPRLGLYHRAIHLWTRPSILPSKYRGLSYACLELLRDIFGEKVAAVIVHISVDTSSPLPFSLVGRWQPVVLVRSCFHCVVSNRPLLLSACRRKAANINSRNYYELLGVERSATQKEIKKAFFELSKEVRHCAHVHRMHLLYLSSIIPIRIQPIKLCTINSSKSIKRSVRSANKPHV